MKSTSDSWFAIYATDQEKREMKTIVDAIAQLGKGMNNEANLAFLRRRNVPTQLYPLLQAGYVPAGTPEPTHPIPSGYDKLQ